MNHPQNKPYIADILSFGHYFGHFLCLFESALKEKSYFNKAEPQTF